MFQRQKEGSVLCPGCNRLVGVNDAECLNCGRKNPGMYGFSAAIRAFGRDTGFVNFVMTATILLFIASLGLDMNGIRTGGLMLVSPSWPALFLLGGSGYQAVFVFDRWWTVLTAGWLHGGVLHLGFNIMWIRNLAYPTAEYYGVGRMVIIYTISGVMGFVFSSVANAFVPLMPGVGTVLGVLGLGGAFRTIGASAPIFGLLGALVYYGRRAGHRAVHQTMIGYAVILGVFGLVFPLVDNQAHLGGFVGGYLTGRFLDPLEPERGDHLVMALVCLAATMLAVVVSFVTGLGYVIE